MKPGTRALSGLLLALGCLSSPRPAAGDAESCATAYTDAQRKRNARQLIATKAKLVQCSQRACPEFVARDCAQWLLEVEPLIPSVLLEARDEAGRDLLDVIVTIEGVPVKDALRGSAIELDPGPHTIRFERGAGGAEEQTVVLREGEKRRRVSVVFRSAPPPAPAAASAPHRAESPPPTRPGPPAVSYVLGAVGVASLGLGAYLGVTGKADLRGLRSDCAPHCDHDDVEATRRKLLFADVGMGAGVALLGVATYLWLARSPSSSPTSGAVQPLLGPGFVGLGGRLAR